MPNTEASKSGFSTILTSRGGLFIAGSELQRQVVIRLLPSWMTNNPQQLHLLMKISLWSLGPRFWGLELELLWG